MSTTVKQIIFFGNSYKMLTFMSFILLSTVNELSSYNIHVK